MPRLENTDLPGSELIIDACEQHGFGSSTVDVCRHCAPRLIGQPFKWPTDCDEPVGIVGEDNVCHPSFEEEFDCGDPYTCEECGCTLRGSDD